MRKIFSLLLLLVSCASSLYAQEMPCDETACPEGGVRGNKWTNHSLKYYIQNYPNNTSSPTSSQCQTAIQNAFSKWSHYTDFTFTRTYNSSQANIILKWETYSDNCGDYSIEALAHSSPGKPTSGSALIHFNDYFAFTMTSSGYNLQAVALKEIGHVLGVDYIQNPSAIMYNGYYYSLDLTAYDLIEFYQKYAFPGSLTGPNLVSSSEKYEITYLPSDLTTSWSINNSHYNNTSYLKGNQDGYGTCIIVRNPSYDLTNAILTAYIKKGSINVDTLYMQPIYAYAGFKGSYTSGNLSGNIDYTLYFNIKANTVTTITSPNFYGATVTYSSSGATPSSWGFNPTTGILNFNTLNTSAPVIINVHDGCGNNYTLYAYASSYYSINVSNGEGGITVTLVEDGDASKDFTLDEPWTIEVINAATGQVMATQSSTSRSETISTAGWPKGIYVVKVTIGKEELTEKVMIK